jgi:regulatory protein
VEQASPAGGGTALEQALRALQRKERTSAELRAWLEARGCEEEDIEAALARLVEIGELDDARFARRYAEDKRTLRGWGPERIREALEARGVAPPDVEAALGEDDRDAQVERAAALVAARGHSLADDRDRARALDYLLRRGFPYEIAYEALRARRREAA